MVTQCISLNFHWRAFCREFHFLWKTRNHREPLVLKIGKTIEKPSLPMVEQVPFHQWWWWEFSKTIAIPSLEKKNHHHSIALKNWPTLQSMFSNRSWNMTQQGYINRCILLRGDYLDQIRWIFGKGGGIGMDFVANFWGLPKKAQHNFSDRKWPPPPSEVFRKFIEFGPGSLP